MESPDGQRVGNTVEVDTPGGSRTGSNGAKTHRAEFELQVQKLHETVAMDLEAAQQVDGQGRPDESGRGHRVDRGAPWECCDATPRSSGE